MAPLQRRDLGRPLLLLLAAALCLAVGSEAHGLDEFRDGKQSEATPAMASFFGAKPEAAMLPEALDASSASTAAKPEAASAMPTTGAGAAAAASSSAPARRSVAVAAGVSCGVAALAVVGVGVAVAYVVRARRGRAGERREKEVCLG